MQTRRYLQKGPAPESGASEVVGVILMIAIVIAAVAIVGIFLFSQTAPQKVPDVSFMTGYDASHNLLYINHNGGDSLTLGTFSVVINGIPTTNFIISDYSTEWSLGKNLIVSGVPAGRNTVAITYNSTGGGTVVLHSVTSNITIPASVVSNPDIITATAYPPVISVPQLMQNITNNSINYYRENGTIIQPGSPAGYIQFNITKKNSSMWYYPSGFSPVLVPLNIGSRVKVTPYSSLTATKISPSVRIFGIGDQIWELTAEKAIVTITNQSGTQDVTSLDSGNNVAINHTWVTGYKDFQSTLDLTTVSTPGSYYTELIVNNFTSDSASQGFTQRINVSSSSNIVINNILPTGAGLFILQYDIRTNSTYFVGNASYTIS
jgi:flagellin-like protein